MTIEKLIEKAESSRKRTKVSLGSLKISQKI
jgi:hypothetical protein